MDTTTRVACPECGEAVWDVAKGHKLHKCWNGEGHASGDPLAFDTPGDGSADVSPDRLTDRMEFDHVIRVREDGRVVDVPDVCAPSLYWIGDGHELDGTGWTLLNGYSGQYRYAGPIMHESEYIGGRMARDIASTPGVYVALVCYSGDGHADEDDVAGWAVARLDEA